MHVSGYYAWLRKPHSQRHHEDQRLLALVRPSWFESGRVYGYRKVHHDLRALGETCSRHRVARLMRSQGWRAQVGYRRRPGFYGGAAHNVVTNVLDRQFNVAAPNLAWITDITYIRTYEGWLYLAVVVDFFSRQVVGWSMDSCMSKDLVLQALLAAVWRRKPAQNVMVHSDQGSQFTSYEWAAFLAAHNLQPSMSTRELARQDIFDYIEMFYNPIRRHGHAANLSPVNYERQYLSEAKNCL